MATSMCKSLAGCPISSRPKFSRTGRSLTTRTVAAVPNKLNTLDEGWKKKFFGSGIFLEDTEKKSVNIYSNIEKKKLLSGVEKAGLLSAAEKAGLSLSKIEELGLLSTAEDLGILSLAESALDAEPALVSSLSIPLIVASIVALVLIPGDNTATLVLKYLVAGGLGVGATALFAGGFVLSYLQDEE